MPRSGAGVYVLPAGQPAITGTTISSTTFNLLTSDLANALTTSLSTDGQTPMVANLSMGNNKITNLAVATLPSDAARFDQVNNPATSLYYSVKSGGAVGNGIADDTLAINTANSTATALGKTLFFPAGTYIATQLTVLPYQNWLGENIETTIKLKNGTNPVEGTSALIWSPSLNCDEASFTNFTFDGNSANNTQGDLMTLYGCRTRIKNCKFMNAASNAVVTNFNSVSAERVAGIEGSFMDITIDSPQKSGWVHYGPNDSNFDGVIIIDAGKKTNSTYFGLYLASGTGSGRFNNVHPWNRDGATNVALSSIYVGSSGNTFTNSHIEGGTTSLTLVGSANTFSACAFYAPRGATCVSITSTSGTNIISGVTGLVYASSNPNYTIINLAGGFNTIELSLTGANSGIYFNDAATGNNVVTLTGYLNSYAGQFLYSGTRSTTDIVNISVGGAGGGVFQYPVQNASAATAFTVFVTPATGTFGSTPTTASYFYKTGKMVHFDVYYTISSVGSANGQIQITLPSFCNANALGVGTGSNSGSSSMTGSFVSANINYMSFSNYNGNSPCLTVGNGHVGGWYIEV